MAQGTAGHAPLKVFLSYSRKEHGLADALADALEARGMDVLIDRRDLPYGEQWQPELADMIHKADAVVWLVSQSSCISRWCNWELGEVMRLGKRLVPIAIEPLSSKDMPEALGKVQLLPHEGTFSMDAHLGTLQFVLETNAAWIKEHTRLADRARLWIARGRRSDQLLRGVDLREAQAWLDARRPTTPTPSAETLDLILASRRAGRTRRIKWIVGPPLAALAMLTVYMSYMWLATKRLPDTMIAMGDIVNSEGDTGFEGSYGSCRLRCMLSQFGQPCVAFSYDRSPDTPVQPAAQTAGRGREATVAKRRCFPKYAADFYWSPSRIGTEAADTEIMGTIFEKQPSPKQSPYRMHWYRALSGDPVAAEEVIARVDDVTVNFDEKTGRVVWAIEGGECQQICIELGDKCKGFSFTALNNRCELFKSVKGLLRDARTDRPVYMPATISGCDDPDAGVDPVTKEAECPPRYGPARQAPVRSQTPAASTETVKP